MPQINNRDVDENDMKGDFEVAPEGTYRVKVDEIYPRKTRDNDEMWGMRLKIVDGEHKGKSIFDNLVFSEHKKAKARIKLITSRLGISKDYVGDLTIEMLLDKECKVVAMIDFYEGKKKNVIPFDGYIALEAEPIPAPEQKRLEDEVDDIPF